MATSSSRASSSSGSGSGNPSRTGFFLRARALDVANKLVSGASALVNNAIASSDDGASTSCGYSGGGRGKGAGSAMDEPMSTSKPSLYTEERCLVFPGYAYVRNDQLNISIDGFAFRLRPLESASRTQKLFVSAARQLASLPSVNKSTSSLIASDSDEPLDVELPSEALKEEQRAYKEKIKEAQRPNSAMAPDENASSSGTSKLPYRPYRRGRQGTVDSVASTASLPISPGSSANLGPLTPSPAAVKYSAASLDTLHSNLNTRLRLFFSQKLVGRRIRVSVYLQPTPNEMKRDGNAAQETCIAKGTLVTELGGVFKSTISVPWPPASAASLPETKDGQQSQDQLAEDLLHRRLRVRTELLSEAPLEEQTIDSDEQLKREMNRSDEASLTISHDHSSQKQPTIRIISDIDDTIKATHVLAGIKAVFRNVFTRPHDELTVAGMREWYDAMYGLNFMEDKEERRTVAFHFVSNSPFELFGVLREFLNAAGFPPGSIRLKEYGGGTSLLGGLWEPAGARKRNGVEEILRTFPDSRFLLVGDSGEQDLELYVSLAAQFPRQILGVFIRDVTTPLPRGLQEQRDSRVAKGHPHARAIGQSVKKRMQMSRSNTGMSTLDGDDRLSAYGQNVNAMASTSTLGTASQRTASPVQTLSRQNSDASQSEVLTELAKTTLEPSVSSSSSSHAQSSSSERYQYERGDEPSESSNTLDPELDQDLLSPNNPLSWSSLDSGTLSPFDEQGYTEVERKVVNLFSDRVLRARRECPSEISLVIFREGSECVQVANELIDGTRRK